MQLRKLVSACALAACALTSARVAAASGTVTVFPLARYGMPAPDGNGTFGAFFSYHDPVLDDAGEVCFVGRFDGASLGSANDDYLVRADKSGVRTILARQGRG